MAEVDNLSRITKGLGIDRHVGVISEEGPSAVEAGNF